MGIGFVFVIVLALRCQCEPSVAAGTIAQLISSLPQDDVVADVEEKFPKENGAKMTKIHSKFIIFVKFSSK